MVIVAKHYSDPECRAALLAAMNNIFGEEQEPPIFLCIGSDRHILDCFGPLTGTMIKEKEPDMLVFGTLDKPLHARNLGSEIFAIRRRFNSRLVMAIDASAGSDAELGIIKLREGPLYPGKALAKGLPAIGDYSVVGMMGIKVDRKNLTSLQQGSINYVYHMARLLSDTILAWQEQWILTRPQF